MSGKFFLDTNVFVYTFDETAQEKLTRATELIQRAMDTGAGIVSFQVVQEFFNVAFRRFAQPMTSADAEQYLSTTFRPLLAIHSSRTLFAGALQLSNRYKLPWYDSLILSAAIEGRCSILYSEDFQHGQQFGDVLIQNPFLKP